MNVDLFAGTGAKQILLRFAEFLAPEDADRSFGNAQAAIGNRLIEIDRDGPTEAATLRTCA